MKTQRHQIPARLETIGLVPPRWGLDFSRLQDVL